MQVEAPRDERLYPSAVVRHNSPYPGCSVSLLIVVIGVTARWRASTSAARTPDRSMLSRATSWRCPDCGVIAQGHGRGGGDDAPWAGPGGSGISDAGYAANTKPDHDFR